VPETPCTVEQLATLALATSFDAPPQISPTGYHSGFLDDDDTLVCCDDTGVFVLNLRTGRLMRRISAVACSSATIVDGGYALNVRDYRDGVLRGKLIFLPNDGSPERIVPYRGHVRSWSPAGDEVAIFCDRRLEVRRWPTMEIVGSVDGLHPTIDWDERVLYVTDGGRHVMQSFGESRERRYLDFDRGEAQPLYLLGDGIANINLGFTLLSLRAGWRTDLVDPLPPDGDGYLSVLLTHDRRGIRTVIDHRPCRFEVDFATGELQTRPVLPARASGDDDDERLDPDELWHPTLDAAVVDDADGTTVLRTVDGHVLTRFPFGACAKAWFDDGRALLVTYPFAGKARLRIEVWRCA